MKIVAAFLKDAKTVDPKAAGVGFVAVEDGQFVDPVTGKAHYDYHCPYLGQALQAGVKEFEEVFFKTASPGGLLTYWGVSPGVEGGQITGLTVEKQINGVWHECPLEDWQYELLDLDPQDLGCVEEHPEGSDRGGYVPTLANGCHYDENGGCWQG